MKLYDPKQKQEVQEFEVHLAKDLVSVLASIVDSCPGCVATATGIRYDQGLVVHNSRGNPVAHIVTKWDGRG